MIHVAVLGYGTVGSGVVEVIEKNKDMVTLNVGQSPLLVFKTEGKKLEDLARFIKDVFSL